MHELKLKCCWKSDLYSKTDTEANKSAIYIEGIRIQGALLQTTNNEINLVKVNEDSPDHSESPILEIMYIQESKEESISSLPSNLNMIGDSVTCLPLYTDSSRQNLLLHIPTQCRFGKKNTWENEGDLLLASIALFIDA